MLTPEKIEELRGLLAKATPGPWKNHLVDDTTIVASNGFEIGTTWPGGSVYNGFVDPAEQHEINAALIVAMRNALPALLDAASRAREDALREAASSAKPDPSWRIPMDKTEAWAEIVARELCAARMRRNGFSESVIQAVRSLPTSGDDLHDAASVIRFLAPLIAEQCAGIAENPNRAGREWVPGSLWDSIARETAAAIRAAFPKEPK